LKVEGTEKTVARAKAYAACGVDAIFVVGVETLEQVKAVHEGTRLPIMVGSAPASIRREDLAPVGGRVMLQGHQPVAAAVKALRETYAHLHGGGAPAELKDRIASAQEMDKLVGGEAYKNWQKEYLR
jgi:carboxyvinyl-carboxyphosphonate phosphorylmutase